MATESFTVGFIGIGTMGVPMAGNIVAAGHDVIVYDVEPPRAARFAEEHGCRSAERPGDLADSDFIVTMLPTGRDVRQVIMEAEGGELAASLKPGTIVIDMSSSEPPGTVALGADLAERGVTLIDAPVSGAVPRAKTGTLAIMIGGDDKAAIERAKPLLSTMGEQLFDTGPLGSGHAMKALNNYVAGATFAATAEAFLIGERFGLKPQTMYDIINVSTGRSFVSEFGMKEVLSENFGSGFMLGLLAKDVGIAADLGETVGLDAPLTRLVRRRWDEAREKLGFDRDNTEAIKAWDEDLPK